MRKSHNIYSYTMLVTFLLALLSVKLSAQNARAVAYVSSSNKGFKKDVIRYLEKDARRNKANLTIKSLNELSEDNMEAYGKVAVIAYISDIKAPVLDKLRELQKTEPSKYVVLLTYARTAPPLPEGIDAATSASTKRYFMPSYDQIISHLF